MHIHIHTHIPRDDKNSLIVQLIYRQWYRLLSHYLLHWKLFNFRSVFQPQNEKSSTENKSHRQICWKICFASLSEQKWSVFSTFAIGICDSLLRILCNGNLLLFLSIFGLFARSFVWVYTSHACRWLFRLSSLLSIFLLHLFPLLPPSLPTLSFKLLLVVSI